MRRLVLLVSLLAAGCADADTRPPAPPAPPSADAVGEQYPAELAGLARALVQSDSDAALGASVTNTAVRYGAENSTGAPSLEVFTTDYGTAEMAEMMGLGWGLRAETDYAAGTEVQASETFDGHPARRTWDAARQKGRLQLLADETFFVEVRAEGVPEAALDAGARAALTAR